MGEHQDLRREAEKDFVTDTFWEKGHLLQKVHISIWVIIGWIAVMVPIYWTVSATLLRDHLRPAWRYSDGITLYFKMNWLFLLVAVVITIGAAALTIRNNHKTKKHLTKEILYDQQKVVKRGHIYDDLMTARFGPEAKRTQIRYYEVPGDKNLETSEIRDAYEKEGVEV